MAAANFGMGITLFLVGGGAYSVDNWLMKRHPALAQKGWFRWLGGSLPLPVSDAGFKKIALTLFWITVAFIVATYSYYRGSVITPFHGAPVSPKAHHVQLTDARLLPDGQVDVHMYVNAGTAADPAHIVAIRLLDYDGKVVESWDGEQLAAINTNAITNDFDYQKVVPGKVLGLTGGVGAEAMVHLPVSSSGFISMSSGPYQLQMLSLINGHEWEVAAHTAAH